MENKKVLTAYNTNLLRDIIDMVNAKLIQRADILNIIRNEKSNTYQLIYYTE